MGYGPLWIVMDLCNGIPTHYAELLVIYFSHLHGVQVVAGSNPVAPTKNKTNREPLSWPD
jgi:hypothetical protein